MEVLRSPTDKFQVLLNGTFDDTHNFALHYTLRSGSNELFLQVVSAFAKFLQRKIMPYSDQDTPITSLWLIKQPFPFLLIF